MLDHTEKSPNALAHGPAKPDDIERVRRDIHAAETRERDVERAIDEMEAACETIREDLREIKQAVARQ